MADGTSIPDWLQGIGGMIEAIGVVIAAGAALWGIATWRRQLIGRRKVEIAEEGLVAAYRVREAFDFIRSPVVFEGEGDTRPELEGEDNKTQLARRTAAVPIERINKASEAFAALSKSRLLFKAYFGPDAEKPFNDLFAARHEIVVAAQMLDETAQDRAKGLSVDRNQEVQWRRAIWSRSKDDPITPNIDTAMAAIETLCGRHLKDRDPR
jgi:hypothetical protein